jgi:hypothetical protein
MLSFLLLSFYGCKTSKWQKAFCRVSQPHIFADPVLQSLQSPNKILLIYNEINHHKPVNKNYVILVYDHAWKKIVYKNKPVFIVGETSYVYEEQPISKTRGDSVLSIFTASNFWQFRAKDEGCPKVCGTGDMPSSELMMVVDKRVTIKNYYAPEWYDEHCCPGDKDRQLFIACKSALLQVK